jgi:predicted MFS family arabinose efflux permease
VGTILGGFTGRMVAGVVAELAGWRMGFVAVAAISVACAAAVAVLLPREQRFVPLRGGARATLWTYLIHLQTPRLLATCGIGFGILFTNVAVYTYVNFYLAAPPFRLTPTELGLVFGVYLIGTVTTTLASGLAVRIGRRATLLLAVGLNVLGVLLTLVPVLTVVIVGLACVSGAVFVMQALSLGFIAATTRVAKSTAVGMYVTTYYVGGSLGGLLPGSVWSHAGWPGVVALLLVVLSAMAVLGARHWRERLS